MSEKMDGVRAYWNGEKLLSRQGKEIDCPEWFVRAMPSGIRLDGELWMGRGTFNNLLRILNSKEDLWRKEEIKYVLFDIVDSKLEYEQRLEKLRQLALPPFVSVVEVEECRGNDHLNDRLQSILESNGEGIVMTEPRSHYVGGRSQSRLKVKVSERGSK